MATLVWVNKHHIDFKFEFFNFQITIYIVSYMNQLTVPLLVQRQIWLSAATHVMLYLVVPRSIQTLSNYQETLLFWYTGNQKWNQRYDLNGKVERLASDISPVDQISPGKWHQLLNIYALSEYDTFWKTVRNQVFRYWYIWYWWNASWT